MNGALLGVISIILDFLRRLWTLDVGLDFSDFSHPFNQPFNLFRGGVTGTARAHQTLWPKVKSVDNGRRIEVAV
jgi:hypothetical protein